MRPYGGWGAGGWLWQVSIINGFISPPSPGWLLWPWPCTWPGFVLFEVECELWEEDPGIKCAAQWEKLTCFIFSCIYKLLEDLSVVIRMCLAWLLTPCRSGMIVHVWVGMGPSFPLLVGGVIAPVRGSDGCWRAIIIVPLIRWSRRHKIPHKP